MGLKLERKPLNQTIAWKSANRLALMKQGIDPRTDKEKKADQLETRQAIRWFEKTGGHIE